MSEFQKALQAVNVESQAWKNSPSIGAPPRSWWVSIENLLNVACKETPEQHHQKPVSDLVDAYLGAILKASNGEMVFDPDLTDEGSVKALETALAPIGRALAALNNAQPIEEPYIETIDELANTEGQYGEKVGHVQIAAIHGIKVSEVKLYLEKPRKWNLPEGHTPPGVKEFRQERKRETMAYEGAAHRWNYNRGESPFADDYQAEEEDAWKAPPESVQELLLNDVPVKQIAKMWRMTEAAVVAVRDGEMAGDLQPVGTSEAELEALTAPEPKKGKR